MNKEEQLKKIVNYVTLSLRRTINPDDQQNQLVHFAAIRFKNDQAKEYLDLFVENKKKKYDSQLNQKAYPFIFAISTLRSWLESDTIILHEGGRNDIQWLYEQLDQHLKLHIKNEYINLEDLAIFQIGLKKTSLKNIAKHYGVYQLNTSCKITKDLHNCLLIHEIWKAFKEH